MKKTFLTLMAIIAMLFAFSSCDELLNSLANSEEQDQTKTDQKNDDNDSTDTGNEEGNGEGGEETESEKSGIDGMVGKLFYQQTKSKKQDGEGRYLYFESSTKVTQFLDDIASTGQFIPVITKSASIKDNVLEFSYTENDWYYNQVNPLKLVFIDNVIIAYSEVQDTIYTKTSDGEGLYGSWEYIDKNENIRTFIIDETKAGTEEEEMYEYTNENGLIMYGEGWDSGCCYYDGKNLYSEAYKLIQVSDERKIRTLKNELGLLEKDPAPKSINDLIGNYYYVQDIPDFSHDNYSRDGRHYLYFGNDSKVTLYRWDDDWQEGPSAKIIETVDVKDNSFSFEEYLYSNSLSFLSDAAYIYRTDFGLEELTKVKGDEGILGLWVIKSKKDYENDRSLYGYDDLTYEDDEFVYTYYSIEEHSWLENSYSIDCNKWDSSFNATYENGVITLTYENTGYHCGEFWNYDGEKIYKSYTRLLQVHDKESIDVLKNATPIEY